jgi:carboxyl-terminal processing protease
MPDVFVPLDTTSNSSYYTDVLRKNVLNDFTLTYTDNHRNELKSKYADINSFREGFNIDDKIFSDFLAMADKAGVKKDSSGLKTSESLIRLQLKALVARNIWDTSAYVQIINSINHALLKAVEAIQDNTFEKLKITSSK